MKTFVKLLFVAFITSLASCGCDSCEDLDCGIGTCVEGICDCPDGYSGTNCENFDPCFNIDCGANGTCTDGTCDCEDGYQGDFCETEVRSIFLGTWRSTDWSCDGEAPDDEGFLIEGGVDIFDVIITDTNGPSFILYGTMVDSTIVVPSQEIDFGGVIGVYEATMELDASNILNIQLDAFTFGENSICLGTFTQ